jgi:hypothetical protein
MSRPARYAEPLPVDGRWPFTIVCLAIAGGLALDIAVTSWIGAVIVGLIVAVGIGAAVDERVRRYRGLPPRRALFELGRRDRTPHP